LCCFAAKCFSIHSRNFVFSSRNSSRDCSNWEVKSFLRKRLFLACFRFRSRRTSNNSGVIICFPSSSMAKHPLPPSRVAAVRAADAEEAIRVSLMVRGKMDDAVKEDDTEEAANGRDANWSCCCNCCRCCCLYNAYVRMGCGYRPPRNFSVVVLTTLSNSLSLVAPSTVHFHFMYAFLLLPLLVPELVVTGAVVVDVVVPFLVFFVVILAFFFLSAVFVVVPFGFRPRFTIVDDVPEAGWRTVLFVRTLGCCRNGCKCGNPWCWDECCC